MLMEGKLWRGYLESSCALTRAIRHCQGGVQRFKFAYRALRCSLIFFHLLLQGCYAALVETWAGITALMLDLGQLAHLGRVSTSNPPSMTLNVAHIVPSYAHNIGENDVILILNYYNPNMHLLKCTSSFRSRAIPSAMTSYRLDIPQSQTWLAGVPCSNAT